MSERFHASILPNYLIGSLEVTTTTLICELADNMARDLIDFICRSRRIYPQNNFGEFPQDEHVLRSGHQTTHFGDDGFYQDRAEEVHVVGFQIQEQTTFVVLQVEKWLHEGEVFRPSIYGSPPECFRHAGK